MNPQPTALEKAARELESIGSWHAAADTWLSAAVLRRESGDNANAEMFVRMASACLDRFADELSGERRGEQG